MVRISINEDIERVLESLKHDFPALDYPELFKLGLSELYTKRERERRKVWADKLPVMELDDEQAQSLAEAREELAKGEGETLSAEAIVAEALQQEALQ